ncbi:putative bifunctional diguanylate cyclase/phosphodiesterase [Geodermatophilus sp. CPCC 206100]|uniref:putative bifunctional diguanylate cyclase/phosphodiesterase n=1 Tax=Geodermatophilus sp. CPCC 206100 TaxID=3020054 RepID=UPI003B00578C
MSVSSPAQLLGGARRWPMVLVAVLAAVQAAALLGGARAVLPDAGADVGARVLVLATQAVACVLLVRRVRTTIQERTFWRRIATAAGALTAITATSLLLDLLPGAGSLAELAVAWAPVAVFPLLYGGLVGWNRHNTSVADPNDTLNGSSAVLAVVAVLTVLLAHTDGALAHGPWWQVQPLLAHGGAAFVLLGTAASVMSIVGMGRDPRAWLLLAGVVADLASAAVATVAADPHIGWAGTTVLVTCAGIAAVLPAPPVTPRLTDPAATTIGAFVVIVASTVVLLVTSVGTPNLTASWCAAVAAAGSAVRLLLNVHDLSQLAVSRKEALTDELTGLANRRAVLRRLGDLLGGGVPVVFGLLDLNKFKEVNDGLGHAAGDDLLRLVAQRIDPLLGPGDLLGRLGGDEFAIVARVPARTAPHERARWLGDRLVRCLAEPFELDGLTVHATAALGLTVSEGVPGSPAATPTVLLRQADAAMYAAKRSGRGAVVYDDAQHDDTSGHLVLVEELRAALATGQLVLHHQPQVDVGTGRTVGVECLVRWQHPVRGLLGPADFLPLAEVHGLMGALTDQVLRLGIAQAADWLRRGLDLRVSLNLSASNLLDTGLPDRVARLLRSAAVPPTALVLEVTESVLLADPGRSTAVLTALADLGITVSIDDFGTGYSSLTYLRELPLGELKLDRSFTTDLLTDARAAAIVASTVDLAHRLGLRVVAEGVEDAGTLARLEALGCEESQGYLHARPLPAVELERWLAARDVPVTA